MEGRNRFWIKTLRTEQSASRSPSYDFADRFRKTAKPMSFVGNCSALGLPLVRITAKPTAQSRALISSTGLGSHKKRQPRLNTGLNY